MDNHGETVTIAEPYVVALRGREPSVLTARRNEEGKLLRKDYESGKIRVQRKYMQQLEPRTDDVSNTLTSVQKDNLLLESLRIRRLIPRECFRLMDVSDEDYDKINTYIRGYRKNGTPIPISESQQYKLAGNSIVVACMEHIFEQLFFPKDAEISEPRQLNIFDIIE